MVAAIPTVAPMGRSRSAGLRWSLWSVLVALVAAVLVTLVWLAGRYESSLVQSKVERDTADAVTDVRNNLTRNLQNLQALVLRHTQPAAWQEEAEALLRNHREWLRMEWRGPDMAPILMAETPYRAHVFARLGRETALSDIAQACAYAQRISAPAYAPSYFVANATGLGVEVMELCLPQVEAGQLKGYLVATYAIHEILSNLIIPQLTRSQEVSFTEPDGTRLALHGTARRGSRVFSAQQLVDLPGNTIVLRIDSWRAAPELFPNVLAALVTGMSIALVSVLVLLGKDMRRRQRAENDLAEALAFRKAMEDSQVTGLRARDLEGRITYVNPAFCQMVGFSPDELLGHSNPAPYWPPELAEQYHQRQTVRLAGEHAPPREGYESIFMRKDGSRFPVLIIEAPLITAAGEHMGWMSTSLDISEQRRVEELSRASQDRLQATARLATVGEMASLLSHELNQPLAAIASYANGSVNLLNNGDFSRADLTVAIQRIAEQAGRAGQVIKSVHDFVRRRDQAHQAISPQQLLDAIMPLVSLQARKLGIQVEIRLPDHLPTVLCDHTMVEQALLNLARNAMQAMDGAAATDRRLVLQVRRASVSEHSAKTWLEFSVADRGTGISKDVAEQLFTPFFTTKKEGMGLGLSLCRTVVEQHGGILWFEANAPQGTIFKLTLPVYTGSPLQPAPT
jgi:two-component system sensor histidine kinase DctS